ncbi:MAG: pseudouridine-5'-phosphate glycosidase [Dehalobacterium sp.]
MKCPLLAETALLTHGLTTISNEKLLEQFPRKFSWLVWVDQGKITMGNIDAYLSFRDKAEDLKRIDYHMLEKACKNELSGALTASGTMAVAEKCDVPLVVTAGMGGIDTFETSRISNDLTALVSLPVSLIATSPKDMLNLSATINWLKNHGIKVLGNGRDVCDGFIFSGETVKLSGNYAGTIPAKGGLLVLNCIAPDRRFTDKKILAQAITKGEEARGAGYLFHPAVNKALDELTAGRSGEMQFQSFVDNIYLALASQIEE